MGASYADFLEWRRDSTELRGPGGLGPPHLQPHRARASPCACRACSPTPACSRSGTSGAVHGRVIQPDDDRPGAPRVALLSHGFWSRQFGADPAVVGRVLSLDGVPHEVVGVLTPGHRDRQPERDRRVDARSRPWPIPHEREARTLRVTGRLKPGVDDRAGQRRAPDPGRPAGAGAPGDERALGRRGRAHPSRHDGSQLLDHPRADGGRGGPGARHRLRQRGQPRAGARRRPRARDRVARGPGGGPGAASSASSSPRAWSWPSWAEPLGVGLASLGSRPHPLRDLRALLRARDRGPARAWRSRRRSRSSPRSSSASCPRFTATGRRPRRRPQGRSGGAASGSRAAGARPQPARGGPARGGDVPAAGGGPRGPHGPGLPEPRPRLRLPATS